MALCMNFIHESKEANYEKLKVFIPAKGSLDYALLLCRWHADGSSHTKMEPDSSLLETHTNPRTVDHRWISYVALSHLDLPGCSRMYPVHTTPHLWSYLHTLLCHCQYRQNGPGLWFPANYTPCNFPMLRSASVPPSMNCLHPLGSSSPSLWRLLTPPPTFQYPTWGSGTSAQRNVERKGRQERKAIGSSLHSDTDLPPGHMLLGRNIHKVHNVSIWVKNI